MPAESEEISFEDGEHGEYYTFHIALESQNVVVEEKETGALFLDYDKIPELPLFYINTISGDTPTYSVYEKPSEDTLGKTIKDNEFERASLSLLGSSVDIRSAFVEIKVRGNGSTIQEKNSYKIRFDSPYSLLDDSGISCSDWVLLNNADSLNTYICTYIGKLCEMDWVMPVAFCNLILNDDYKGTYYLVPAVTREASDGRISRSGYLFENDAYWWSKDGLYFKTGANDADNYFGWTFKYPEITSANSEECQNLKHYLQALEDEISKEDGNWENYIDTESFASWILSKDLIGISDGGGSNMYYYKYDYDPSDPTSSKILMGPLWDFDSAFGRFNSWSSHSAPYISELFDTENFHECYKQKWVRVSENIFDDINNYLDSFYEEHGNELVESWELEESRYQKEIPTFDEQRKVMNDWLLSRIPWLNNQLSIPADDRYATDIGNDWTIKSGMLNYSFDRKDENGVAYYHGWAYVLGEENDAELGLRGILADGKFYSGNPYPARSIQEEYNLSGSVIGYALYLSSEKDGTLCVLDEINKIIYVP